MSMLAHFLAETSSVFPVLAAKTPKTLGEVIGNLRDWVMGMAGALATLFLTFGGLRYLLAAGDAGEVDKAKRALKYAAIGFGIVVLAPIITTALEQIVGKPK